MVKINTIWLRKHYACRAAQNIFYDRFGNDDVDLIILINLMKREKQRNMYFDWALWLIHEAMTKVQLNRHALYLLKRILPLIKEVFKDKEDKKLLKDGIRLMRELELKTRPLSRKDFDSLQELIDLSNNFMFSSLKIRLDNVVTALHSILISFQEGSLWDKKEEVDNASMFAVRALARNERGRITNKSIRQISVQVINASMKILTS